MIKLFFLYLVIVNLMSFSFMYIDKQKAKKKQWRIPEKTLWGVSLLGGAIGSTVSMHIFKHKTKHIQFKLGFPILAILQIAGIWYVYLHIL